jgi:DNA recombination protein RmuC
MNLAFDILVFAAGVLIGAVTIWAAGRVDSRTLREAIQNRDAKADKLQADLSEAISARASLATQLEAERKVSGEKLALIDEAQKKLSDTFAALSAQALQHNNQSFLDLATLTLTKYQAEAKGDLEKRQAAIDQTLKPVRESLEKVDAKIGELEKSRAGAYAALNEQVKTLSEGQAALRSETTNLVNALRSPTVRGRWGEIQLRRVVEMAGMQAHCDFFEQQTVTTEDGRLRPDMRVRLPGDKNIIVDAKTPLESYLKSIEAPDEETRRSLLRAHAQSVRTHINNLGKKAYWDQFKDEMPELVIMFLPGEMFFSAALEADPTLIEAGIDQNIILATPTTLIGLLRAVYYGWRQEKIQQAAQAISDLGRDLYKRLADMSEHFFKLGNSLGVSVEAYNKAVGSLEARVLVSARKFKDLTSVPSDAEIKDLAQIESVPRALQAPEMAPIGLFPAPEPQLDDEAGELSERSLDEIADLRAATPAPVLADTKTPKSPKSTAG